MTERGGLVRSLLLASRPVSWVNTAFPFAAAYVMTVREVDLAMVVGTVFFLVPYNLLMYGVNDVFDYASDVANPRKGGVEGALLAPGVHRTVLWAAALSCAPFVVFLVVAGNPASTAWLAVSLFTVLAYSVPGLRFKERPFLDSVTSSTHFVSPAVVGLALAGAHVGPPTVLVLTAFFLWGMAAHAFGAVQDVIPDRQGGIGSVATVIGARATVRLAVVLWVAAGCLMLLTPWPGPLGAVLAVPYVLNAAPWWNVTDARSAETNAAWRRFIWLNYLAGFLATMLLILAWRT